MNAAVPVPLVHGASRLPLDRGVLYGEGLFETWRMQAGRSFRLEAHLRRMERSAKILGLPLPARGWQQAVQEQAARAGAARGSTRARLTLTAGPAPENGDPAALPAGPPMLFLSLQDIAPPQVNRPVTAVVAGPRVVAEPGALGAHKTLSYLRHLVTLRRAREQGGDEGLVADATGCLVGGTRGNLFLVCDAALLTPPLASGCLPGITRGLVISELAPRLGLAVREESLPPERVAAAREAFLTGSIQGILPLAALRPGAPALSGEAPVSKRIEKAYLRLLASELATQ